MYHKGGKYAEVYPQSYRKFTPIIAGFIIYVVITFCFPDFHSTIDWGDRPPTRALTEEDLPPEEPMTIPHKSTVLLGILTSENAAEKERRESIRETYLNTDDARICRLSEYMRQHDESNGSKVICRLPYIFVKGYLASRPFDHDDNAPLTIDANVALRPLIGEDDILYLNIAENSHKGKSASYFKWASSLTSKYNIDYVAKARTSTLIHTGLMLDFMNKDLPPYPYNRRIYGGSTWGSYENSNVFAEGAFYFMSSDLAYFISRDLTADIRKELSKSDPPQEDKDIGTFVYSHRKPIKFQILSQNQFWFHPIMTKTEWDEKWQRMNELPIQGTNLPVHGICKLFHEEKKFELPDGVSIKY